MGTQPDDRPPSAEAAGGASSEEQTEHQKAVGADTQNGPVAPAVPPQAGAQAEKQTDRQRNSGLEGQDVHVEAAPHVQRGRRTGAKKPVVLGEQVGKSTWRKNVELASQIGVLLLTVLAIVIAVLSYRKTPIEIAVEGLTDNSYINGDTYANILVTGTGYDQLVVDLFLSGQAWPSRRGLTRK